VSLTLKVTREFETFSGTLMLSKKQLIGWRRTSDSGLVALIDESSIAGSSSMRKAVKNGFILFEVFFGIGVGAKFLAGIAEGIQPSGIFRGILLL